MNAREIGRKNIFMSPARGSQTGAVDGFLPRVSRFRPEVRRESRRESYRSDDYAAGLKLWWRDFYARSRHSPLIPYDNRRRARESRGRAKENLDSWTSTSWSKAHLIPVLQRETKGEIASSSAHIRFN